VPVRSRWATMASYARAKADVVKSKKGEEGRRRAASIAKVYKVTRGALKMGNTPAISYLIHTGEINCLVYAPQLFPGNIPSIEQDLKKSFVQYLIRFSA